VASLLLPLVVLFAFSLALGHAIGRRAILLPLVLGAGFGVLIAVNGGGDTALGFLVVWLIAAVAAGIAGARVGARYR
jgi:hypothetical protein